MVATYNDTTVELLEFLHIDTDKEFDSLLRFNQSESRYLADLKVNVKGVWQSEHLDQQQLSLIWVALATNSKNDILINSAIAIAKANNVEDNLITEATACASLMAANNVLYRFRHFADKEIYNSTQARIKMNIMMKPLMGHQLFELISLIVSAVNGCERCVTSHEKAVIDKGATEAQVFDAIRMASVYQSLDKIIY